MNTVWVLVCDSAKARFFEVEGDNGHAWRAMDTVIHEESRSKASELTSDHLGQRAAQGRGVHHNAMAPGSSPKEVETEHFARALVHKLVEGMQAGRFRRWVLVAPPHFAGAIGNEMTGELKKHLLSTVDKDLVQLSASELAERLHDSVRIPLDQQEVLRESKKHPH